MKTVLRSRDLTCPSCVGNIELALRAVPGVETATVHFTTGRIEVWHDPERVSVGGLIGAVRSTGYDAKPAASR